MTDQRLLFVTLRLTEWFRKYPQALPASKQYLRELREAFYDEYASLTYTEVNKIIKRLKKTETQHVRSES
jgi:hypothetical protein